MSGPTVIASWTQTVLDFAEQEGLDAVALREKAGLDDELLRDRDARVPYARHLSLWWAIQDAVADENFGLRMGTTSANARSLDVFGYLIRSSRTTHAALRRMERYGSLVNEAAVPRCEVVGGAAILIDGPQIGPPWPPLYADQVAANLFALAIRLTGVDLTGIRVELPRPAPRCQPIPHVELFGDRVEFDSSRIALHLPRNIIDKPFLTGEPELATHLEARADQLLRGLPGDDFLAEASEVVRALLHEGAELRLDPVAVKLAMSKRSLQRRLEERGTHFQELVDGIRYRVAIELLSESHLTLDECADRLGYANVTAFRRAFVRWAGAPPGRFRKGAGRSARSVPNLAR